MAYWYYTTIYRKKSKILILINYDGYESEWDEWITIRCVGSYKKLNKLAKFGTHGLYHHNKSCAYTLPEQQKISNPIQCSSCGVRMCVCAPINKCFECIVQWEIDVIFQTICDGIDLYMHNISRVHCFDKYIINIIHQYAIGIATICCNVKCNAQIIINHLSQFDFDNMLCYVIRDEKSFKNHKMRKIYGCSVRIFCHKCTFMDAFRLEFRNYCVLKIHEVLRDKYYYCYCSECHCSGLLYTLYICEICNKYYCDECMDDICDIMNANVWSKTLPTMEIKTIKTCSYFNKPLTVIYNHSQENNKNKSNNNQLKQNVGINGYDSDNEFAHIDFLCDIKLYSQSKWNKKSTKFRGKHKDKHTDVLNKNSPNIVLIEPEFAEIDDYNYDYLQKFSDGYGILRKKAMKPTKHTKTIKKRKKKINKRFNTKKIQKHKKKKFQRRSNKEYCDWYLKDMELDEQSEDDYYGYESSHHGNYENDSHTDFDYEYYVHGMYDDETYYDKQKDHINMKLYANLKRIRRIKSIRKKRQKRLRKKYKRERNKTCIRKYTNKYKMCCSVSNEYLSLRRDDYNYDYLQKFSNYNDNGMINKEKTNQRRKFAKKHSNKLNDKQANKKSIRKYNVLMSMCCRNEIELGII